MNSVPNSKNNWGSSHRVSSLHTSTTSKHDGSSGKDWSCFQSLACKNFRCRGSSGNDWSILQQLKSRDFSLERCFILAGRYSKLFFLRSKDRSKDKQTISCGISIKLQQLKSSSVKEDKPENDGGNIKPLHPEHQTTWSSFKFVMEDGSWLMADSFAQSIFKDFKFPRFSGKLSSFEQPVKFKVVSPPICSIEDGSSL